jgi:hypothetical protein
MLIAEHIVPGDVYMDDDAIVYTVESVRVSMPHVIATVRFHDGGDGERMWEWGKETPLVHGPDWQGRGNG